MLEKQCKKPWKISLKCEKFFCRRWENYTLQGASGYKGLKCTFCSFRENRVKMLKSGFCTILLGKLHGKREQDL
jgi:hypothetical protein